MMSHQQNLLMTLSNSDEDYETLKTAAEFESLSGTLPYLAPERLSGGAANISGDMFALGAVFYEMLTGESAFATENFGATLNRIPNEDPLEIAPLPSHFPESVSDLVRQMLHKDPATLKRATNLAQAALESDPHLALSHIAAGWAEEFNGRLESALTYYDTADMLDPRRQ